MQYKVDKYSEMLANANREVDKAKEVMEIKTQVDQITAADGPCVGIFMVHIGFLVIDSNKEV